jgi:hypothetical protein
LCNFCNAPQGSRSIEISKGSARQSKLYENFNTPTIPDDLIDRLYAVIRPVLGTTNPTDMSAAFQRLFPEPGVLDVPDKFKPADVTAKDYLPFIVGLYLGSKLAQEFEIHLQGEQ